jgi:hypothetical protein
MSETLILKGEPIGSNQEDIDVLSEGAVDGRIFLSPAAPQDRQWMWTLALRSPRGPHADPRL